MAENRHVLDCTAAAFAHGVRPGMARAAAAALLPSLRFRERDPLAERAALEGLAGWAGRYTPNVALAERPARPAQPRQPFSPHGLLLEVSGSLKLFGGIEPICAGLAQGVQEMGYTGALACAPTAQGAWLLARGGASSPCLGLGELHRRLQPLSVETLDCDARTLATLEAVGVRTLGEVLALPRAGLARRFGEALSDELDRALGARPDPRAFFASPERFHAALEFPVEVHEAGMLVFAVQRLLVQLGGFLVARDSGVQRLRIDLFHKEALTSVEIGLVRPSRDTGHLALLAREKLAALALREPVRRIALAADEILALAHTNLDLLDEALKRPGDWAGLLERLRARLGNGAVNGIAQAADHRPEAAWRVMEPGERGAAYERGARPLWLLQTPKRLAEVGAAPHRDGPLALLAGPERIESGWWDGHDAARDYFIARAQTEALLWIYRERQSNSAHWYLHGIFG